MTQANKNDVEVQIVTSAGNYPASGYAAFNIHQKLSFVLEKAKDALELQNTSGWVPRYGNRNLDPGASLESNGLSGFVQIAWEPVEPGGGASAPGVE